MLCSAPQDVRTCFEFALGDVLETELLQMGNLPSRAPVGDGRLLDAQCVGDGHLRAKELDDLVNFHKVNF